MYIISQVQRYRACFFSMKVVEDTIKSFRNARNVVENNRILSIVTVSGRG